MYLVYVDETGDDGLKPGASDYYMLSALVIHETAWLATLDSTLDFRRRIKAQFGVLLTEELHASALIATPGKLSRIPKWQRLLLYREILRFIGSLKTVSAYHVCLDKATRPPAKSVFDLAWKSLIQRVYNSVSIHASLPAHRGSETFMLLPDAGHEKQLRRLARKIRRFNPVPSRFGGSQRLPVSSLVEDPVHRDSAHSYFIQLVDVCAYALKQRVQASKYIAKKGARHWFQLIAPICETKAASNDPWGMGVVRITL